MKSSETLGGGADNNLPRCCACVGGKAIRKTEGMKFFAGEEKNPGRQYQGNVVKKVTATAAGEQCERGEEKKGTSFRRTT